MIKDADFVLIESTYGDRLHKSLEDTRAEFEEALIEALKTSAKVLVPTFVVDRAPEGCFMSLTVSRKNIRI